MKVAEHLAVLLEENARSEKDNEAAYLLRRLGNIYDVAYEIVWAKNREHQNAAYKQLEDLIKGKPND